MGGRTAITGVTLVDGRGEDPLERAVVVVEDATIVAVGAESSVPRDGEAQVLDAAGATLMPGIIDAHCHLGGASHPDEDRWVLEDDRYQAIASVEHRGGLIGGRQGARAPACAGSWSSCLDTGRGTCVSRTVSGGIMAVAGAAPGTATRDPRGPRTLSRYVPGARPSEARILRLSANRSDDAWSGSGTNRRQASCSGTACGAWRRTPTQPDGTDPAG